MTATKEASLSDKFLRVPSTAPVGGDESWIAKDAIESVALIRREPMTVRVVLKGAREGAHYDFDGERAECVLCELGYDEKTRAKEKKDKEQEAERQAEEAKKQMAEEAEKAQKASAAEAQRAAPGAHGRTAQGSEAAHGKH